VVGATFVTPLFLILVFGVVELGLLAHDSLATSNASRAGSRAASAFDNRRDADFRILSTAPTGSTPLGRTAWNTSSCSAWTRSVTR